MHFFYNLSKFLIKILWVIWIFWRRIDIILSRITWVICITIPFTAFWFSLSSFLFSDTPFSFISLQNSFWCWKLDAKFTSSFFYSYFSWNHTLNKFFTNILWNYWVFLFLWSNIILAFVIIIIGIIIIAWWSIWFQISFLIGIRIWILIVRHYYLNTLLIFLFNFLFIPLLLMKSILKKFYFIIKYRKYEEN